MQSPVWTSLIAGDGFRRWGLLEKEAGRAHLQGAQDEFVGTHRQPGRVDAFTTTYAAPDRCETARTASDQRTDADRVLEPETTICRRRVEAKRALILHLPRSQHARYVEDMRVVDA